VRILVVGSGAREDALSWRLAQSPSCSAVFAAPGNAGTALRGENWSDVSVTDGKMIAHRAREAKIDLVLLGPENAIAAGVGDRLRDAGITTFGPSRAAGRLESSKVWAKRFMDRYEIPTARARVVRSLDTARKVCDDWTGGCVVKADGLAGGKGVVVTDDADEAFEVLKEWFGSKGVPGGGSNVLLEERLTGREVSVFAIGDGTMLEPVAAACDYKRAGDGDTGPNTGGMGAYSPPVGFPANMHDVIRARILEPALRGLREEGERYIGVLYCGLMWADAGPKVIEFNVRFGDPETQVLMPRVRGDFARLLHGAASGALDLDTVSLDDRACVGVVIASREYPRKSEPVSGLPADLGLDADCVAFWGASTLRGDLVDSGGGRVLTVTALGGDLADARAKAYATVDEIAKRIQGSPPLTYRTDIASL
jgi:phosphoribosylamine--glycine ligase